jgi:hypothetical protein
MTDSAHRILLGFDIATEVDILHVAPRETNQLCWGSVIVEARPQ